MKSILTISRPRFWLYLAGPYLVGASLAVDDPLMLIGWPLLLMLLYFLLPANILLYGINDLADRDTDAFNAKKGTKEHRVTTEQTTGLLSVVIIALLMGLIASWFVGPLLVVFLLLSIGYSVRPLRFKAHQVIDSLSNVLYIIPGIIGYIQFGGGNLSIYAIIAAWAWASCMHLFSAIPDIRADTQAGLHTSAIMLGYTGSLVVCSIGWSITLLSGFIAGVPLWLVSIATIYPLLPLATIVARWPVGTVYWTFPYINALIGGLLFVSTL